MHVRASLVRATGFGCLVFASFLIGCGDDSGTPDGTSAKNAAEALTKSVDFENGTLVDGLMPPATDTDVTLAPLEGATVEPGDTALMGFDLDNPNADNGALLALVEFSGAEDHFEVDLLGLGGGGDEDAGVEPGAAGSGGGAGQTHGNHFELSFKVKANVCDNLCDDIYEIPVKQSVKLKNKKISKHASASIKLDCSKKGDHKVCGKSNTSGGKKPGSGGDTSNASGAGAQLVSDYNAVLVQVCECAAGAGAASSCTGLGAMLDCSKAAFDKHLSDLGDQLECMQDFIVAQKKCVDDANAGGTCSLEKVAQCDIVKNESSSDSGNMGGAVAVACGEFPLALQTELGACEPSMSCDGGKQVPSSAHCDGVPDCSDGTDEMGCDSSPATSAFACASEPSKIIPPEKLCDGNDDCSDASDETVCAPCDDTMTQIYSVFAHCDGKMDCENGSDEMNCGFPCSDGSGEIEFALVCDKKMDCKDGSDELACGEQMFPCGDGSSIPFSKYCDGTTDCKTAADEVSCPSSSP